MQPTNSTTTCACCGFDPAQRTRLDHVGKRVAFGVCRVCGMEAMLETALVQLARPPALAPTMQRMLCHQLAPPRERSYIVLPPLTWWERVVLWVRDIPRGAGW